MLIIQNIDEHLRMLNHIILQAEEHGSDAGGSYQLNDEGLIRAMNEYLIKNNLQNIYCVTKNNDMYCEFDEETQSFIGNGSYYFSRINEDMSWLNEV